MALLDDLLGGGSNGGLLNGILGGSNNESSNVDASSSSSNTDIGTNPTLGLVCLMFCRARASTPMARMAT